MSWARTQFKAHYIQRQSFVLKQRGQEHRQHGGGRSTVLHFCLLDKIGLEESIRLLCGTWLACLCVYLCVRKWEERDEAKKIPVCAREDHLTCLMYEGLKLSFKRVEGPLHTKYETCDRHIVTHENTWQSSFAACSLQPATPTHNTKQVCFASRNLACSAVQGGVHLCVYASDQKNVWILQ